MKKKVSELAEEFGVSVVSLVQELKKNSVPVFNQLSDVCVDKCAEVVSKMKKLDSSVVANFTPKTILDAGSIIFPKLTIKSDADILALDIEKNSIKTHTVSPDLVPSAPASYLANIKIDLTSSEGILPYRDLITKLFHSINSSGFFSLDNSYLVSSPDRLPLKTYELGSDSCEDLFLNLIFELYSRNSLSVDVIVKNKLLKENLCLLDEFAQVFKVNMILANITNDLVVARLHLVGDDFCSWTFLEMLGRLNEFFSGLKFKSSQTFDFFPTISLEDIPIYTFSPVSNSESTSNPSIWICPMEFTNKNVQRLSLERFSKLSYFSKEYVLPILKDHEFLSLGGAQEIGASSYLYCLNNKTIMIDCGAYQDEKGFHCFPPLYALKKLDFLIVTHAHHDHIGALHQIPLLFPECKIYMSEETLDIYKETTDFSKEQFGQCNNFLKEIKTFKLGTSTLIDDIKVTFLRAGHILGACQVVMEFEGKSVLFTGDLHFSGLSTVSPADRLKFSPDIVICEGTSSELSTETMDNPEIFKRSIADHLKNNKNVLIPSFSIGRTQEVMNLLDDVDLEFDGICIGTGIKVNELYSKCGWKTKKQWKTKNTQANSMTSTSLKVVVASGGMLPSGSSSKKLFDKIYDDNNWVTVFPGFCSPKSFAGKILDRSTSFNYDDNIEDMKVDILSKAFDERRIYKAGISAHAKRDEIISYLNHLSPRKVLLVHGDLQNLKDLFCEIDPKYNPSIPENESIVNCLRSKSSNEITTIKNAKDSFPDPLKVLFEKFTQQYQSGDFKDKQIEQQYRQACFEFWLSQKIKTSDFTRGSVTAMTYALTHLLLYHYKRAVFNCINTIVCADDKAPEVIINNLKVFKERFGSLNTEVSEICGRKQTYKPGYAQHHYSRNEIGWMIAFCGWPAEHLTSYIEQFMQKGKRHFEYHSKKELSLKKIQRKTDLYGIVLFLDFLSKDHTAKRYFNESFILLKEASQEVAEILSREELYGYHPTSGAFLNLQKIMKNPSKFRDSVRNALEKIDSFISSRNSQTIEVTEIDE